MEEVFAQLTVISKLEDDQNFGTFAERPLLTIIALERGLGMVDVLIDHFVKFKHETCCHGTVQGSLSGHAEKAEQLGVTTSSQSLLPPPLLCILHHSVTFTTSSQNAIDIPLNMITSVLLFISG
jgi:hypothetical protein